MTGTMAKKTKKEDAVKAAPVLTKEDGIPESGPYQFPLRFGDARLARAVSGSATRNRRSMNQEILFILEESMRIADRWPPPA